MSNLADNILNAIFTDAEFQKPEALWLGLFTQNGEIVGGNYSRVNVTGKFETASGGVTKNSEQIKFPVPSAGWGTVTQAVLFDAQNGGEVLAYMPLQQAQNISASSNVFYQAGQLQFSMTVKA